MWSFQGKGMSWASFCHGVEPESSRCAVCLPWSGGASPRGVLCVCPVVRRFTFYLVKLCCWVSASQLDPQCADEKVHVQRDRLYMQIKGEREQREYKDKQRDERYIDVEVPANPQVSERGEGVREKDGMRKRERGEGVREKDGMRKREERE